MVELCILNGKRPKLLGYIIGFRVDTAGDKQKGHASYLIIDLNYLMHHWHWRPGLSIDVKQTNCSYSLSTS